MMTGERMIINGFETTKVHTYVLVLEERPTMVLRCLQNEMSFLKARKSNSNCSDTKLHYHSV